MKPICRLSWGCQGVYLKWPNARTITLKSWWLSSARPTGCQPVFPEPALTRTGAINGSCSPLVWLEIESYAPVHISVVPWSLLFCQVNLGSCKWKWVTTTDRISVWLIGSQLDFHFRDFSAWFINSPRSVFFFFLISYQISMIKILLFCIGCPFFLQQIFIEQLQCAPRCWIRTGTGWDPPSFMEFTVDWGDRSLIRHYYKCSEYY